MWRVRTKQALERRETVLRELEQSGLPMVEFCRRRGLVYGTVAAWRSTARRRRAPAFVEVDMDGQSQPIMSAPDPGSARLYAEVQLPGGVVLRVYGNGGNPATGGTLV